MITVGHSRRKENAVNEKESLSRAGEILTSAGIGLMAAILIGAMPDQSAQQNTTDAVYAMSTAVADTREELVMPEKSTSAEGEASFFEIIGEFIAGMIFGES